MMPTALWFTCLVLLSQLDLHAVLGQCMGGGYPQTPPPYPIMVKSNNDNGLNSLLPLLLLQMLTDNGDSGCGNGNGCGCRSGCGNGCGCRSGNGCGCGSGSSNGCGCGGGCGSGSGGGCGGGSGYGGGCGSGNGCGCCNNYPVPIPYNPPCNSVVVN